ncbi:MAG: SDR family oxidoreductase [Halobacteriales archaeon]|nr:SDR family oxidoreductase [Halobacteriales archaeon]
MPTKQPEHGAGVENTDLSEKTYVVTGSTSGIGRETAVALARLGAHVVVHGRNEEKGRRVVDEIEGTDGEATFVPADFSTTENVRGFADEIRDEVEGIDALLNNAGGYFSEGRLTEDGVAYTFAVNHLAPFVLTAELLPLLRETGDEDEPTRVVTTSSGAHRRVGMEFDALTDVKDYSGFDAYCRSKLANVLFTRELARRLDAEDAPVTANCFHPGFVPGSGFPRETPLPFRVAAKAISAMPNAVESLVATTVPEGAETQVYLAVSSEVSDISGEYFYELRPRVPSDDARDDEDAIRLWEVSGELTGVKYDLPESTNPE